MIALDALYHLVNFVLPAVFVSGALAFWGRRYSKRSARQTWLINSILGVAAIVAGLIFFGVDSKMLTYAFLVVTSSVSQLVQTRHNGRKSQ